MPEIKLTFESGEDTLSVRTFSIQEGISRLFEVSVLALSENADIDLESLVGKPASLRVQSGVMHVTRPGRHLRGIVSHVEQLRVEVSDKGRSTYLVVLSPALWLLTQRRGHRIFQRASIPDIIDELLAEWQIQPAWQIDRGAYPKLEMRVQYGETDHAFLCRLLEEAGIAFTFPETEEDGSRLTFGDHLTSGKLHDASPIDYVDEPGEAAEKEFVTDVKLGHGVRPGAFAIRDHDFRNPSFDLLGKATPARAPEDRCEQYHYQPGAFLVETGKGGGTPFADDKGVLRHDAASGAARAERMLVAERTGKRQVSFRTNLFGLHPGTLFTMARHPRRDLAPAKQLLITDLETEGSVVGEWTTTGQAVFAEEPYRPAITTPKPEVKGVQSAIVVGPRGEEIHTDEFGRVRVQFPWDREGKCDDDSSCWMRVSQGWAGTGFGAVALPRVGQEVLVAFLGGDPDQPMVVGRVFNAKNVVPYKLPDHRTRSTWKSCSSPGGDGYNEIMFEDAAGKELVHVQAQRDLQKLVKNDETEVTRGHHQLLVGEGQDIVIQGVKKERVEGDSHLHVKADQRRQVGGKESVTVGGSLHQRVGQSLAIEAGQEIHLRAAMNLVIEAASVTLKDSSGNFIHLAPGGIEIVGTMVRINSGGMPGSGAGASPDTPREAAEAVIDPPAATSPLAAPVRPPGGGEPPGAAPAA